MQITVRGYGGKQIRLRLPSGLVLNRLSAILLSAVLKNKDINISGKQLHILFREIKAYKATHPEWKLIEVHSHDGEIIEIVV